MTKKNAAGKSGPSSLHVHTRFSDGQAEPEAYVEKALELGLARLGFSEHGPVPFDSDWNMAAGRMPEYVAEIRRLKEKWTDRIEISLGLEVDYIPGVQGPASFRDIGLDYTLGGVHYLPVAGRLREIDHTPVILQQVIAEGYDGDGRRMISDYFGRVRRMLREDPPTILAHLDLVRKFNQQMQLFDECESWYADEIFRTLEELAQTRILLEVNTAPLYRGFGDEPYPSLFTLKMAKSLEIPIILTSDAHAPDFLAAGFAETRSLLRSCGYSRGCP